ncbi:unnamed protein product [Discosporangium mesarthrocarpum]
MRYFTQVECRNRRGPLKSGRKVTGLAFKGEEVLVTTNDSRLRLYNTEDFGMSAKYKGLSNDSLQIKASFSEDGQRIICGSENGKVSGRRGRASFDTNRSHESFVATEGDPGIVTVAAYVPETSTRACVRAVRGALSKEKVDAGGYLGCMVFTADYEGVVRVFSKAEVLLS